MDQEGVLKRISGLAEHLRLTNLPPLIEACRKQFDDDDRHIDVAVFGRFKAGKSSFLNHLTGQDVLPIGVVPLTAVITRLRFGPQEQIVMQMLDGTVKPIPLQDIGLYVVESENPNNSKGVSSVDIELPTLEPLSPLRFVDTPGIDSAFAHNTETTFQWLPHVGAALLAASCDAPLSDRDLALLDELRRQTPRVVLLLTKADLLNPDQRAEVLSFVKHQLSRRLESEIPVCFYSVRPEYPQFKAELETAFLLPLVQNHDQVAGQIGQYKLRSLIARTLDYARIALAASTQIESSRGLLRIKLAGERRDFEVFREELQVLALKWSADALDQSLEALRPQLLALQQRIAFWIQEEFCHWPSRLPPLLKVWRRWLQTTLDRELTAISSTERPVFIRPLERAELHLTRALQALQGRLAEHVQTALGVKLEPHDVVLDVPEPAFPPVDVAFVDAAFGLLSPIIPMGLFRSTIERWILRKSRWEVEKNLSRLASGWRDRVAEGIKQLIVEAEKQATDELVTLEHLLDQSPSKEFELRHAINELQDAQAYCSSDAAAD